jgi:hypothetical protein
MKFTEISALLFYLIPSFCMPIVPLVSYNSLALSLSFFSDLLLNKALYYSIPFYLSNSTNSLFFRLSSAAYSFSNLSLFSNYSLANSSGSIGCSYSKNFDSACNSCIRVSSSNLRSSSCFFSSSSLYRYFSASR